MSRCSTCKSDHGGIGIIREPNHKLGSPYRNKLVVDTVTGSEYVYDCQGRYQRIAKQGPTGATGPIGPIGPAGPSGTGIQTGILADRPSIPDNQMAYIATDSSVPVSVWDGTQWVDVDTSASSVVSSLELTVNPPTVNVSAGTTVHPAFLQTEDIIHPAGLVEVTAYGFGVAGSIFDNAKNEGVTLASSTDGGSTWSSMGLYGAVFPATVLAQSVIGLSEISDYPQGTMVRFGIGLKTVATTNNIQILSGLRIVVRRV